MPSVMNANGTMQSVSPDMGSVPGSLCGQSEVLKQVMGVIEKKARNMEKKKVSPVSQFEQIAACRRYRRGSTVHSFCVPLQSITNFLFHDSALLHYRASSMIIKSERTTGRVSIMISWWVQTLLTP